MLQVPRLYDIYKAQGIIENFEQLLDNIFTPLFEVSIDPSSHPQLHLFLRQVVGFDMVDDESKPERRVQKHMQVTMRPGHHVPADQDKKYKTLHPSRQLRLNRWFTRYMNSKPNVDLRNFTPMYSRDVVGDLL